MMALAMTPRGAPLVDDLERPLLERARARDPVALRAFVIRHQGKVFALLSRVLGPGPHVEDLAQETFLRAFRALPDFDPDGPARVTTWLLTIATRLALDDKRKRRFPTAPLEAADLVPGPRSPATPEKESARRQLGDAIAAAAAELSEDMRAAFVLADVHGFTMGEIAAALGIPENTAKTRVFRARQHMRERLAGVREEHQGE